ncbi:VOC family protein [Soonwooa sp.]|uniref:VOC family protein n=1 Tax=Soonwooa sp. TaxID=1938592 RepID=UPI0028A67A5F|nr:VOC family protein [Soonwooa sp.]
MIFRVARHTSNIEKLSHFYSSILGFEVLGSFKNHDNYDGVFLGKRNENWHLEFTQSNEASKAVFDDDDILVFYPTSQSEYDQILENLKKHQVPIFEPKNSYWKVNGKCFEDCDRHKIIVSHLKIQ